MNTQHGFTLPELIFCLAGIATIGFLGTIGYVVWHFIAKYW